jgi:hypothetical protein
MVSRIVQATFPVLLMLSQPLAEKLILFEESLQLSALGSWLMADC